MQNQEDEEMDMGEIVWVPYERKNDRLVANCYHYDAVFEFDRDGGMPER